MLGLTNEERRQLEELAGVLAADDPTLARALSDSQNRPARRFRCRRLSLRWGLVAVILSGLGMPLLVLGVVLQTPIMFAFGTITLLGGPVFFTIRLGNRRGRPPTK